MCLAYSSHGQSEERGVRPASIPRERIGLFGELEHVGQDAVQTAPGWRQALRAVGSVNLDVLLRTV